jgi:integrase
VSSPFRLFKPKTTRFWQVRFKRDGRYVVRSLETEEQADAQHKAEELVRVALANDRVKRPATGDVSLVSAMEEIVSRDERRIQSGARSRTLNRDQRSALSHTFRPFFGDVAITDVGYPEIQGLVDALLDRGLSPATVRRNLVFLTKTLKHAHRMGWIEKMPPMPTVEGKAKVRGWITEQDYKTILRFLVDEIESRRTAITVRYNRVDEELRLFITFMVNTFLRPSDAKQLKHQHIEIVHGRGSEYLRISTDFSKTINSPVISMPEAVAIYRRLMRFQKSKGYEGPDSYLFFPKYRNREVALQHLRLQFQEVLARTGLSHARTGEKLTLYSLRHTAIMFRLLGGERVDLVTLARNARTSVDMIDRFYARHLTAEMNVDLLHAKRSDR